MILQTHLSLWLCSVMKDKFLNKKKACFTTVFLQQRMKNFFLLHEDFVWLLFSIYRSVLLGSSHSYNILLLFHILTRIILYARMLSLIWVIWWGTLSIFSLSFFVNLYHDSLLCFETSHSVSKLYPNARAHFCHWKVKTSKHFSNPFLSMSFNSPCDAVLNSSADSNRNPLKWHTRWKCMGWN